MLEQHDIERNFIGKDECLKWICSLTNAQDGRIL